MDEATGKAYIKPSPKMAFEKMSENDHEFLLISSYLDLK